MPQKNISIFPFNNSYKVALDKKKKLMFCDFNLFYAQSQFFIFFSLLKKTNKKKVQITFSGKIFHFSWDFFEILF